MDFGAGTSTRGVVERCLYALTDASYNITSLMGFSAGTSTWGVVERYLYDPYGQTTVTDAGYTALSGSAYGWQHTFQGGKLDEVSGLINSREPGRASGSTSSGATCRPTPTGDTTASTPRA